MSELTNTSRREPNYGKAARQFNAERALGAKALDLLRRAPCTCSGVTRLSDAEESLCLTCALDKAALLLGLDPSARKETRS